MGLKNIQKSDPYDPPSQEPAHGQKIDVACVGFVFSVVGAVALLAAGSSTPFIRGIAMCIAFSSLPGPLFSAIALFRGPRRLAAWGLALGLFGTMCLPTVVLAMTW